MSPACRKGSAGHPRGRRWLTEWAALAPSSSKNTCPPLRNLKMHLRFLFPAVAPRILLVTKSAAFFNFSVGLRMFFFRRRMPRFRLHFLQSAGACEYQASIIAEASLPPAESSPLAGSPKLLVQIFPPPARHGDILSATQKGLSRHTLMRIA